MMILMLKKESVVCLKDLILDKLEETSEREEIARYSLLYAELVTEIEKEEQAEKEKKDNPTMSFAEMLGEPEPLKPVKKADKPKKAE